MVGVQQACLSQTRQLHAISREVEVTGDAVRNALRSDIEPERDGPAGSDLGNDLRGRVSAIRLHPFGWRRGTYPAYQGKCMDLPTRIVLQKSSLKRGLYTFYFGVDLVQDGKVIPGEYWYDLPAPSSHLLFVVYQFRISIFV